jgi:hypothetical protein
MFCLRLALAILLAEPLTETFSTFRKAGKGVQSYAKRKVSELGQTSAQLCFNLNKKFCKMLQKIQFLPDLYLLSN